MLFTTKEHRSIVIHCKGAKEHRSIVIHCKGARYKKYNLSIVRESRKSQTSNLRFEIISTVYLNKKGKEWVYYQAPIDILCPPDFPITSMVF